MSPIEAACEKPPQPYPSIDELNSAATRMESPCGAGAMVWRRWGQGRPVVMLHGGGGYWAHWLRNIRAIADSRATYVPDMPGFGDSALPLPDGSFHEAVEAVVAGIEQIVVGESFDLVGFSFGGLVAGFVAERMPRSVGRLILVGTPGFALYAEGAVPLKPWRKAQDSTEREAAHRHNLGALMLHDPRSIDATSLAVYISGAERDRLRDRGVVYTDALREKLRNLTLPVYGIWGNEDVLYRSCQDKVLAALKEARGFRRLCFIDGAGHWVPYEGAPRFNPTLHSMLSDA